MQKIAFPVRGEFNKTVKRRVDQYFEQNNLAKSGGWRMAVKTSIILAWLVTSYLLLVFFSASLLMAIISAFLVAQGFVLAGFNIMHDGNHGSYSKNRKVNWLMGFVLDLIGGSSILWRQKHNILHHTYTNINNVDDDIDAGSLMRFSPEQEWKPWHRYQHLYAFPLYSLLSLSWMLFSDFKKFFSGRIGDYELRKPTAGETTIFFLTKAFYYGYMIVLPLFFHPLLHVLIAFVAIHLVLGFTLSIVFQLAHTVEGNAFPKPDMATGNMDNEWAIHQVQTTADFARHNKFATWYLGGLNFQIEHHLFAKICHIHYPALSKIVENTCREFSIPYVSYPSVRAAIAAHYRFLRALSHKEMLVMA